MMSIKSVKTGLMAAVFGLMAFSFTASAILDPDIISSVSRVNGVNTTPAVVVKGGLTTGALPYIDRTVLESVFGDVSYFGGMDYIQTAGGDKNDVDVQYQVTVNKAGTLYLIIDNRVGDNVSTNPPTLTTFMTWVATMGFTSTGYTIDIGNSTLPVPATVYALPLAGAGTTNLGVQNDTTGTNRSMYVIAAAPTGWNLTNKAPLIAGVSSAVTQRTDSLAIAATITDDGIPATPGLSILWTTVSKPAGSTVTYDPSTTVEDPTITFSNLGVYVIKVTASDGDKAISKTMQVTYADTFAVAATERGVASNDSDRGPDSAYNTTVIHARNYYKLETNGTVTTRRKVGFLKYDISAIKTTGKVFANSYLTLNFKSRSSNRPFYVYGIKEDQDSITVNGITWNTAPGLQNTPAPVKGTEITIDMLDKPDLSPLLLSYSTAAEAGTWLSTPPSVALDDLLNTDTDGTIILMFISYYPQNTDFEIYNQTENRIEPVTGLKGVILRGNMTKQIWAHNPDPANNFTTNAGLTQLSWTNPDPNQPGGKITCDVYFRHMTFDPNDDPNSALPDYGYTTLASGISDNFVTLPEGTLQQFNSYRWIVDVHDTTRDETARGYLWTFDTNNGAPTANIEIDEIDRYVWLNNAGDPNSATVNLDGKTSDDGLPSGSYTIKWTQVGTTPAVVDIDPNTVDDTTVILTQTGTYQFTLTADDSNLQMSDTVQIVVAANPCAAAQAMPGYTPIVGDLDNDCGVDLDDLLLFVEDWLKCSSLAPCN